MPTPAKPDDHKFQVGDRVTVSLSAGGVVDGVVKAIINRTDGVRLQVDYGKDELVYLWQVRPLSKVAYASDAFDAELHRRNQPTRTIVHNSSTDVGGSGTPVGATV